MGNAAARGLHPEMLAEIDTAHVFVCDDIGRDAGGEHRAVADDVCMIANTECFTHVVIGNQHADVALFQKFNDLLNFQYRDRINARERFVESA